MRNRRKDERAGIVRNEVALPVILTIVSNAGMGDEGFDYIVVGAGSSGCVVAARLSEDPRATVLLLEAGGQANHLYLKMPLAFLKAMPDPRFNWTYWTEPEPHLDGRRMPLPRGRVIGGSGSIDGARTSGRGAGAGGLRRKRSRSLGSILASKGGGRGRPTALHNLSGESRSHRDVERCQPNLSGV